MKKNKRKYGGYVGSNIRDTCILATCTESPKVAPIFETSLTICIGPGQTAL